MGGDYGSPVTNKQQNFRRLTPCPQPVKSPYSVN